MEIKVVEVNDLQDGGCDILLEIDSEAERVLIAHTIKQLLMDHFQRIYNEET